MTFKAFPNLALAHLQSRFIYYAATLEPMLQPFSLLQVSSVSFLTPPCLCPGSTLPRMPNSSFVCLKECLLTATTKKQPNKQKTMSLTSPSSLHCQVLCEASPTPSTPDRGCSLLHFLSSCTYSFYNIHHTVQPRICSHVSFQMDCKLLQAKTASFLFSILVGRTFSK